MSPSVDVKPMTFQQFIHRWMRVNGILVLFSGGRAECEAAYQLYLVTRRIPKS